jgi:hypothetical protein
MYQNSIKNYEPIHIGNDWGFYIDIENYQYNINSCTNKIIKRNQIHNNANGDKYKYDYDFEKKIDEKKKSNDMFIKISSFTIISAAVSYLVFYMS